MSFLPRPAPDPLAVPAAYMAAAKAKLKRDREAYRAFRAVDQKQHEREHERRVTADMEMWAEEVRLFGEDVEILEPEAEAALRAHRAAEDHVREATEYARQQRAAYELIKGKARRRRRLRLSGSRMRPMRRFTRLSKSPRRQRRSCGPLTGILRRRAKGLPVLSGGWPGRGS